MCKKQQKQAVTPFWGTANGRKDIHNRETV